MKQLYAIIVLISFLLNSCTPKTPTLEGNIANTEVETKAVKETELPGSSLYQHPISVNDSTPTPPGASFVELPEWLKDPSSQVVLYRYPYGTQPPEIGFFNATNGELATIPLPFEFSQYYWKDSNHIVFYSGYCNEPLSFVMELDISRGTLSPVTPENPPEFIADCYGLEELFETIRINTSLAEPTVEILEPDSETWFSVTAPNDGISDIQFKQSPNKEFLGIVQIKGPFQFDELWHPIFGTQVSIYHIPDRKLVASFTENENVSQDLLFTDNSDLVYVRGDTPCIISFSTTSKKCIHIISNRFNDSAIILGDSLKDSTKLSFLYFNFSPHQGGWCIYDLFSGGLNCPTDQFEELKGQIVTNFALSPDEKFLLIEYDDKGCPIPWCDFFGNSQTAVIDISARKFYKLGDSSTYQAMSIFRDLQPWRPAQ